MSRVPNPRPTTPGRTHRRRGPSEQAKYPPHLIVGQLSVTCTNCGATFRCGMFKKVGAMCEFIERHLECPTKGAA